MNQINQTQYCCSIFLCSLLLLINTPTFSSNNDQGTTKLKPATIKTNIDKLQHKIESLNRQLKNKIHDLQKLKNLVRRLNKANIELKEEFQFYSHPGNNLQRSRIRLQRIKIENIAKLKYAYSFALIQLHSSRKQHDFFIGSYRLLIKSNNFQYVVPIDPSNNSNRFKLKYVSHFSGEFRLKQKLKSNDLHLEIKGRNTANKKIIRIFRIKWPMIENKKPMISQ